VPPSLSRDRRIKIEQTTTTLSGSTNTMASFPNLVFPILLFYLCIELEYTVLQDCRVAACLSRADWQMPWSHSNEMAIAIAKRTIQNWELRGSANH